MSQTESRIKIRRLPAKRRRQTWHIEVRQNIVEFMMKPIFRIPEPLPPTTSSLM